MRAVALTRRGICPSVTVTRSLSTDGRETAQGAHKLNLDTLHSSTHLGAVAVRLGVVVPVNLVAARGRIRIVPVRSRDENC